MYDGIAVLAKGIHAEFNSPELVAGYINGLYKWSAAEWDLFPHSTHVQISITASEDAGDVLDVEKGDASPQEAAGWIERRKQSGLWRPTIYCARSVIPAVRQATGRYVLGTDYDIWVADWTGKPHGVTAPGPGVPAVCAAVQYASTAKYDVSIVNDDGWPHRTAAKPAPPKATAPTWPKGMVLKQGMSGGPVEVLQTALNGTGLYGVRNIAVDGVYGVQTVTSVRNFQAHEGLAVDGVAGPLTRAKLKV